MNIRIGFAPGSGLLELGGQDPIRRVVHIANRYGYDSLWLSDMVIGIKSTIDPIVALSMIATYSDKLKFGTSVLGLSLRNPIILAKELATLDYLSNGRLLPAIGLGEQSQTPRHNHEFRRIHWGKRADEAIEIIRNLWENEQVSYSGEYFKYHNISISPKPIQKPSPPIWLGGRSNAALKRVGRLGDGWLVSQATPTEINADKNIIFDTAIQHRRTFDTGHIGTMLGFHIAGSVRKASKVVESLTFRQRPEVHYSNYTALGPPERIIRLMLDYQKAGASKFVVRPICPSDQAEEQLELFGREILPFFHISN